MKRLFLHNLGCAKNQIDGEMLAGWSEDAGISLTDDPFEANVIVVNTCAFIQEAKEEAVDSILEASRFKDHGNCRELYVCGCFPELYRDQLDHELPEVDGFFGVREWPDLLSRIAASVDFSTENPFLKRRLWTPDHYAFVRIADGCDRGCMFCIIPKIRGTYQSRQPGDILGEAHILAEKGVKELLPVAQELNSYGQDLNLGQGNKPLIALLDELCRVEDIEWIRPLYLHPPACDKELFEFWAAQPKLCRYLDLPIEHASNRILRLMGRAGRKEQIRKIIDTARKQMDDVVIRTSIIVGFPGETEEDFRELLDFVSEIRFERLGSFQYSAEEGTPAAALPDQVPTETKEERQARLMELQADISHDFCSSRVGDIEEVFVDRFEEDSGYSITHGRQEMPELDGEILIPGAYPAGTKLKVEIKSATEYDLFAKVISAGDGSEIKPASVEELS